MLLDDADDEDDEDALDEDAEDEAFEDADDAGASCEPQPAAESSATLRNKAAGSRFHGFDFMGFISIF